MDEPKAFSNPNNWVVVAGFILSLLGGVASYFKALSDIRNEINVSLYLQSEKIRNEMHANYATKEEISFIKAYLNEMKDDLKTIKNIIIHPPK